MATLLPVTFHGDTLYVTSHNNQPYVPMKPVVEGMEMDWSYQSRKIQSNKERWATVAITATVAGDGKNREMLCLPLRKLPGWLMTLQPSRIAEEKRAKVIQYQNKSDDVLWEHWIGHEKKEAQPQTTALALPEKYPIRSRDDLSFTARDSKDRLINWLVPHDPRSFWDEGLKVGRSHFEEVIELAGNNEDEAFNAIRFAISCSEDFERGKAGNFQSNGWGIEMGFCDEIAKAVIVGLRALKYGAEPFSEGGKKRKRMVKKS